MKKLNVRLTLTEEMLGMMPADPDVYSNYIAANAPDALKKDEEIEIMGVDSVIANGTTIFPRDEEGNIFLWDYQLRGFFKDACGMLKRATGSECSKVKAYKKVIDGCIFVNPRKVPVTLSGDIGICQRPLRAQTAQGERVALASSETVPAGSTMEFEIELWDESCVKWVKECLDYGKRRGLAQWRNSGKGTFVWEELK